MFTFYGSEMIDIWLICCYVAILGLLKDYFSSFNEARSATLDLFVLTPVCFFKLSFMFPLLSDFFWDFGEKQLMRFRLLTPYFFWSCFFRYSYSWYVWSSRHLSANENCRFSVVSPIYEEDLEFIGLYLGLLCFGEIIKSSF